MLKQLDTVIKVLCTSTTPLQFTIMRREPSDDKFEELLTANRDVVNKWLLSRDLRPVVGTNFWVGPCTVKQPAEEICPTAYQNAYGQLDNTIMKEFEHA